RRHFQSEKTPRLPAEDHGRRRIETIRRMDARRATDPIVNLLLPISALTPGDVHRGLVIGSGLTGAGLAIIVISCLGNRWLNLLRGSWSWGEGSRGRPIGRISIFCIGLSVTTFGVFAIFVSYELLTRADAAIFL